MGDVDPTTAVPGDGAPSSLSQTIVATLDESAGALIVSIDPDDRTVVLPTLALAADGASWEASGQLRPVTVADTRVRARPTVARPPLARLDHGWMGVDYS